MSGQGGEGFARIPWAVLAAVGTGRIEPGDVAVYGVLAVWPYLRRRRTVSLSLVARELRIERTRAFRSAARLETAGLIKIERSNGRRSVISLPVKAPDSAAEPEKAATDPAPAPPPPSEPPATGGKRKSKDAEELGRRRSAALEALTARIPDFAEQWKKRLKAKKPGSPSAEVAQLEKLAGVLHEHGKEPVLEAIEAATLGAWKGIFPRVRDSRSGSNGRASDPRRAGRTAGLDEQRLDLYRATSRKENDERPAARKLVSPAEGRPGELS